MSFVPTTDATYQAWLVTYPTSLVTLPTFTAIYNVLTQLDLSAAQILQIFTAGAGVPMPVVDLKVVLQAALDAMFDAMFDTNFSLPGFIRGGMATGITAPQVGTFLATIMNNYRILRASISGATTVAQLQAVNIQAGWPANS